eukprot:2034243-Rhodomonas_salina.1
MESAFDGKGAIEYIRTGGGQRAFANPHDSHSVLASMSSIPFHHPTYGDPRRFVQGQSHDGQFNYTDSVAGSWMVVDLKLLPPPTASALASRGVTRCGSGGWRDPTPERSGRRC